MSLGDELRLLRAQAGGPTPLDIADAAGVEAGLYCQLEQRYREMGDDETLEKLAAYFGCDPEILKTARSHSRKSLSQHLSEATRSGRPVELTLRTGAVLTGSVVAWDHGAVGLDPGDGGPPIVVQRHAVIDW